MGRNEGEYCKLISLVIKKVQKNRSLEHIADTLESTPEEIAPIFKAVKKHSPDYNVKAIYKSLKL